MRQIAEWIESLLRLRTAPVLWWDLLSVGTHRTHHHMKGSVYIILPPRMGRGSVSHLPSYLGTIRNECSETKWTTKRILFPSTPFIPPAWTFFFCKVLVFCKLHLHIPILSGKHQLDIQQGDLVESESENGVQARRKKPKALRKMS